MMLKMSQKIRQTSRTFIMDGMAPTRASTTTWGERQKDLEPHQCFTLLAKLQFFLHLFRLCHKPVTFGRKRSGLITAKIQSQKTEALGS